MRHGDGPISSVVFITTEMGRMIREAGIASVRDESHPPRPVPAVSIH